MHETALMQNMLAIVDKVIEGQQVKKVNSITLSVGKLSNALPDALTFAFEALTADTPLKGCKLILKELPAVAVCEACGADTILNDFPFSCPKCGGKFYTIVQGEDIYIESIDCELEKRKATNHGRNQGTKRRKVAQQRNCGKEPRGI